jgi:ribbon-helix-helix CopG family protein
MALNRRAEILFSEDELERLRREAARRGVSLGELVRDALRRTYLRPMAERRQRAIEFLTEVPPVDVGSWDEAKKLIGRYAGEKQ